MSSLHLLFALLSVGMAPTATLSGHVWILGTRDGVAGAEVLAACTGAAVEVDASGGFSLSLPAGRCQLTLRAPGFRVRTVDATLSPGERQEVAYSLDRTDAPPYQTVVRGDHERRDVARHVLHAAEAHEAPGTTGDPFRAVLLLPGVSSPTSGIAYPIVRGTQPAATGTFIDGVRVPVLFHLFLGPAVVHPDLIDEVAFYPGVPPPELGRQLGGAVVASVRRPQREGVEAHASVDLLNAGGLVAWKSSGSGTAVTVAGRLSYSPWLIAAGVNAVHPPELEGKQVRLDFADYQARVEQRVGSGQLRLLALGSRDLAGTQALAPDVDAGDEALAFHRLDLRWRQPLGAGALELGATAGVTSIAFDTQSSGIAGRIELPEELQAVRASWSRGLGSKLELQLGGDAERHRTAAQASSWRTDGSGPLGAVNGAPERALLAGAFAQLLWSPSEALSVMAAARLDSYHLTPGIEHVAFEPRLTVRDAVTPALTLKAGGGVFHQPPTTLLTLPVADVASLTYGLQEALEVDGGAEWRGPHEIQVSIDGYYTRLSRTVEFNPLPAVEIGWQSPPGWAGASLFGPAASADTVDASPNPVSRGDAYGVELLVRKALGDRWYGWLSYSLQRSTRRATFHRYDDEGRVVADVTGDAPFLFDQTHVLNAAVTVRLPRGWTAGAALHVNSGRPEMGALSSRTMRPGTLSDGRATWITQDLDRVARLPPYVRLDARVAKTWALHGASVSAYLDVLNATAQGEVTQFVYVDRGGALQRVPNAIPVIIPMLGASLSL